MRTDTVFGFWHVYWCGFITGAFAWAGVLFGAAVLEAITKNWSVTMASSYWITWAVIVLFFGMAIAAGVLRWYQGK